MRHFRLLIALLFLPAFAHGQTTVTGHVKLPDTSAPTNAKLCFTLLNFSPNVPKVIGTGALVAVKNFCISPAADGSYSTSLYGNNLISPAATNWRVDFLVNGIQVSSATYLITHSPFNLDTETPLTSSTPAGPNQLVLNVFPFTQLTPATTWTIPHNFNDANTIALLAGLNGNDIFPDTKNCRTDLNNCVVTFVTPTAGFAVVVHAAAINIATSQPNAIISNSSSPQTVQQPFTVSGNLTATAGQNALNAYNINGILSVDGQKYANLAAAFADCPASPSSCIIDMRRSGVASTLSLGTFDPGAVSLTLLLGPYTYTVNQITIRPNLRILGTTPVTGINAAPATTLNATGGNATPPFVLAQVCGVTSVVMSDFALAGTGGNTTQNGFNLIAPNCGGLWYSKFENVVLNGFGGISWNFDAQVNGSIHQFLTFDRVGGFRATNGNYALQIIGRENSFSFKDCEFDGIFNTQDGKTNINIAEGTNTIGSPYNINFNMLTNQYAGVGILVNGADSVTINQPHFELVEGLLLTNNGTNFGAMNITMHDGGAFTSSGIGTVAGLGVGNGYIVKNNAGTPNASVSLVNFHPFNVPDNLFLGNTGSISNWGMCYGPGGSCTQVVPTFFANPVGLRVGSGTAVLGTSAISGSGVCATAVTVTSGNVLAGDSIEWAFNGVMPATYGGLTIHPQAGNGSVLFSVCNPTAGSITPAAATLNWSVVR